MRILLAVSGGIDSMYLANQASELFPGARFAVAHCNFCLRGAESDGDEAFVREFCESAGLECFVRRFATRDYADGHGISVEMAARDLRYAWFAQLCREEGFDAVAVAHNADDNAETLLLNIVRGCGSKGLRGMSPDSSLHTGLSSVIPGPSSVIPGPEPASPDIRLRVLRPLLDVPRSEIEAWMMAGGHSWREDSSNAVCDVKRNVLRHKVLPVLKELNPALLDTLFSDMRHWAQADALADGAYRRFAAEYAPGLGSVDTHIGLDDLLSAPQWEYMLWRLTEGRIARGQFDDLVQALDSYSRSRSDSTAAEPGYPVCPAPTRTFAGRRFGQVVTCSDGIIILADEAFRCIPMQSSFPACSSSHHIADGTSHDDRLFVSSPGVYALDGQIVTIVATRRVPGDSLKAPAGVLYARADFPFELRHWRHGDFIRPFGLGGRKRKLSDIFSDLKLSLPAKRSQLVLCRPCVIPGPDQGFPGPASRHPDPGSGSASNPGHVLAIPGLGRIDESLALCDSDLDFIAISVSSLIQG